MSPFPPPDTPPNDQKPFRILTLDGGGSKGMYTLGVLREVEALAGAPLCEVFDLIYGTSTGSIIGALLALGHRVDEIHTLYMRHVPSIMRHRHACARTQALGSLARGVFGAHEFSQVRTGLGIVATNWETEAPFLFKSSPKLAHGRLSTFSSGFGVPVADAVRASCSAYPFFERTILDTPAHGRVTLIDGGYCANDPTLYAMADALAGLQVERNRLQVLSVGVGTYPDSASGFLMRLAKRHLISLQLLQKTLEINTRSMEQLRSILYRDVPTIRISDAFQRPEMATSLLEHDPSMLERMHQAGRVSFARHELDVTSLLR